MLDQVVDILVIEVLRHERQIFRRFAFHLSLEELFEQTDIFDDRVHFVAIERQRLLQLVEDTHEIEHEAVRLDHLLPLVLVRPVHPRDRLQERVIAHRLVQIHGVEDRRVEPGQKLLRHDQNLWVFAKFCEVLANLLFFLFIQMPLLHLRRVIIVAGVNHRREFGIEKSIKRLLVESARFTIHRHQEGFVAKRLDVIDIMSRDMASDLGYSLPAF